MLYVRDVADLILARCSNVTVLSPIDFTIIAEWEKEGIPLDIILASINQVCDGINTNGGTVSSIGDFQGAIKRNFVDWLQTKSGKNGKRPKPY